jgi:hypothetical protein
MRNLRPRARYCRFGDPVFPVNWKRALVRHIVGLFWQQRVLAAALPGVGKHGLCFVVASSRALPLYVSH